MDKPKSILITSACSTAGTVISRTLLKSPHCATFKIHGMDTSPHGAALHMVHQAHVLDAHRMTDQSYYINELIKFSETFGPTILIPTHSKDVRIISAHSETLKRAGFLFSIPHLTAINLCESKKDFAAHCTNLGISCPKTLSQHESITATYPLFIKPNSGSGSKQAERVANADDLHRLQLNIINPIIQEFVSGPEVTVDVFTSSDLQTTICSARLRLQVHGGQSISGQTVDAQPFYDIIKLIVNELKLCGPSNFQFILSDYGPVLIEVNPRFAAGGLALSIEAGLNSPELLVCDLLGIKHPSIHRQPVVGLKMAKYYTEHFWSDAL